MKISDLKTSKLRIFPKKRQIPKKQPKTFILFPFELHAKMRETFEEKEEESLRLIKAHLTEFKKPYVVSSHGKDSVVLVHLILRACKELKIPMIEVWLNHTLNVYKEEKEYWDKLNKLLGIEDKFRVFYPPKDENGNMYTVWSVAEKYGHLPHFRSTSKHLKGSYKNTNTPECCAVLKKQSIKDYLKGLPEDKRYDCVFVGTRAEESQIRSLGVLQRCRSYFVKTRVAYPHQTATPLSYWKKINIFEYFSRYHLPENPTYKIHDIERMGCASCPAHKNWEFRLLRDPTSEGFGMFRQNMKILKGTELARYDESIQTIHRLLKDKKKLGQIPVVTLKRLLKLLNEFDSTTSEINQILENKIATTKLEEFC